ncbi:unnamed protein product [Urochloa humidicola]
MGERRAPPGWCDELPGHGEVLRQEYRQPWRARRARRGQLARRFSIVDSSPPSHTGDGGWGPCLSGGWGCAHTLDPRATTTGSCALLVDLEKFASTSIPCELRMSSEKESEREVEDVSATRVPHANEWRRWLA